MNTNMPNCGQIKPLLQSKGAVFPSSQFVKELEQKLRFAYRAEAKAKKPYFWPSFNRIFIPALSAVFVLTLIFFNLNSINGDEPGFLSINNSSEENIIKDIDGQEIKGIDEDILRILQFSSRSSQSSAKPLRPARAGQS